MLALGIVDELLGCATAVSQVSLVGLEAARWSAADRANRILFNFHMSVPMSVWLREKLSIRRRFNWSHARMAAQRRLGSLLGAFDVNQAVGLLMIFFTNLKRSDSVLSPGKVGVLPKRVHTKPELPVEGVDGVLPLAW